MNNIPISVGLPFLKCSTNPSQTVNKKTSKKSKTGTTRLVCKENIERIGRDPDIDHERSKYNQFLTEINSTDDYLELIETTKIEINKKLQEHGKKQLRKDTVDNISLIIKPNLEALQQFTSEEQHKFFKDSKKTIEKIWNIDISVAVEHYDEDNPHLHINFMPLLDNELGFKTFNAKKFLSLANITKLNREYSKEMQKLGWNVKDMNVYEDMNQEERKKYKETKKEFGKSSLQFKSDKKNELDKEIKQLDVEIADKKEMLNILETDIEEKSKENNEIYKTNRNLEKEYEELNNKCNIADEKLNTTNKKIKKNEENIKEQEEISKMQQKQIRDNNNLLKDQEKIMEKSIKLYTINHLTEIKEKANNNYLMGFLNRIFEKLMKALGIKKETEKDSFWNKELDEYDNEYIEIENKKNTVKKDDESEGAEM